jgi:tetratricopeptide (TPR) repeat protein
MAQIPRPLFFRESPALDKDFFERQGRLLKFGLGDRAIPEVSDCYLYGFLEHLQAHEALLTYYGALAKLSPEAKEKLVAEAARLVMERYSSQLHDEMRHNTALAGRGCFYVPPADEAPAPGGAFRTLNFLTVSAVNTVLSRYINYFPEFPGLYHALALTLTLLGRIPEAVTALKEELKKDPTHRECLDLLAHLQKNEAAKKARGEAS